MTRPFMPHWGPTRLLRWACLSRLARAAHAASAPDAVNAMTAMTAMTAMDAVDARYARHARDAASTARAAHTTARTAANSALFKALPTASITALLAALLLAAPAAAQPSAVAQSAANASAPSAGTEVHAPASNTATTVTAPPSTAPTTALAPATLVGAQAYTLHASETGKTYRIQISAIGPEPAGGYPVLYVLDGDAIFPVVSLAAQGMFMRAQDNNATPLLIVGIGYPNGQLLDLAARAEDYTPPSANYSRTGDRLSTRFGGAEKFHRFLSGTLRRNIQQRHRINPQQQALLGHSYGGLFGLYALFNHPNSFRHYLIASPSIWWNERRILQDWNRFQTLQHAAVGVRLSVGEYEQTAAPYLPPHSQRAAQLERRGMVRETQSLGQQLSTLPRHKIAALETALYPRETHASSLMPAINDGLKWLFARCKADAQCHTPTQPTPQPKSS